MTLDALCSPLFGPLDASLLRALDGALAGARAELIEQHVRGMELDSPLPAALQRRVVAWARDPRLRDRQQGDWLAVHVLGRARCRSASEAANRAALENLTALLARDEAGGGAAILAPRRASGWGVPVFESCLDLGVPGDGEGPAAGDFAEKLAAAHEVVNRLWPEVPAWVRALVPAVASLGGASPPGRSEGYDAGGPIYLSPRTEVWDLAESMVHELQHHRFKLWARAVHLPSLTDQRYVFLSPYRADPRRLFGVHLGLHAFVTVNELRYRAGQLGLGGEREARSFLKTHFCNLFAWRTVATHEGDGEAVRHYLAGLAERLLVHGEVAERLIGGEEQARLDQHFARRCAERAADGGPLVNGNERHRDWGETIALVEQVHERTFTTELAS
jgi:hypothetical protein